VPFAAGGEQVWPICINCHDLKDRVPVGEWPVDAIARVVLGCTTPEARLLLAHAVAEMFCARRDIDLDGATTVFWDGYRSAFPHGGPSDEQDHEEAVREGVAAVVDYVKAAA
jgi:hypothetical protein